MREPVPLYDLSTDGDLERLGRDVSDAYAAVAASQPSAETEDDPDDGFPVLSSQEIEIPDFDDLIGIDPSVRRQIQAALRSGKRHIMLYGPPGTGKTEIARWLAGLLNPRWKLITGSADWSSQDIIGGYQPVGGGDVAFVPGILLQNFDRPLIIDELNRCDIDKVIGPLFTVLSGQASTLPYRTNIADPHGDQFVILPQPTPGAKAHEFAPGPAWRLIATINSIDKASLYQMSYALTRRFGWVYIDRPSDLDGFVVEYLRRGQLLKSEPSGAPLVLGEIWRAINDVRVIGPAPIIDLIKAASEIVPQMDFLAAPGDLEQTAYLDGLSLFILPMLDGILSHDASDLAQKIADALNLDSSKAERLKRHFSDLAI
jgi:MoxR-like ATPase